MKVLAQVISWLFMPLLMPMYVLLLVMFVPSNQDYFFNQDCLYILPLEAKGALLYMFGIFCVLAPGLSFIILQRRKMIGSLEMNERQERNIPIVIMLMYCLVLYFMFIAKSDQVTLPKFVYALPLSGAFVAAAFFLLNRWRKISIHAASSGIATGFVLAYILHHVEYQLWMLSLTILVSGLVMSARLYLEKHTLNELWIGWLTGGLLTFVINYFY